MRRGKSAGLFAIRPEFTYVHQHQLGDMLIVDNRYRILVRGDRPF